MDSLQIRTGQISLQILDDEGNVRGIFRFNPEDIESAKRVAQLETEFAQKQKEFEEKSERCETTTEKIELLDECVEYFKGLTDSVFGEGTCDIVFGETKTLSMFFDFFDGITPYYEKASKDRLKKYAKPNRK